MYIVVLKMIFMLFLAIKKGQPETTNNSYFTISRRPEDGQKLGYQEI